MAEDNNGTNNNNDNDNNINKNYCIWWVVW